MKEEGEKWDDGKMDWFLLPLELIEPLNAALLGGEKKGYGNFSCMKPFKNPSRRFYNGQMRHTRLSQIDPLAIDKETGAYHLACVAFNALMRLHHCLKEKEETLDGNIHDRPEQAEEESLPPLDADGATYVQSRDDDGLRIWQIDKKTCPPIALYADSGKTDRTFSAGCENSQICHKAQGIESCEGCDCPPESKVSEDVNGDSFCRKFVRYLGGGRFGAVKGCVSSQG